MNPILYEATRTTFKNNGLGILSDAQSCTVSQERNGEYELEMEYPVAGIHFQQLALRRIIVAKPDQVSTPQPFRIYEITKPLGATITVYARHIAYDLMGVPVSPFTSASAADAMAKLRSNAAVTCPFSFTTDKSTTATMTLAAPTSIWELLGGREGGILDVYGGGEYEFDKFDVVLHKTRGVDRGMVIRYGKNLTSLQQEESCASVYTGVYPYWKSSEGALVELPEKTLSASGTYSFTRIKTVDFSEEWETAPTTEQLRNRATRYMSDNQIGVPSVSLNVGYAQLGAETVGLCDPITVEFPTMGVSATAECVALKYDVLRERYDSIDIGSVKARLSDMLIDQRRSIRSKPNTAKVRAYVTERINSLKASDIGAVDNAQLQSAVNTAVDSAVNTAQSQRFDGKFLHIAYSYVNGGGATNSREHYEHCAQNDYDAVKTDLRLTSDNQLVCCHDAGLTFNDSGYIISYNADNATVIHNITKAQFLNFTFNSSYNGSHCHTCDLETYLNICKTYGKIAYINIRGEYISETVAALIAALKKTSFGMENVIVNSFTMDALTAARAAESGLYLSLVIDPFTESQRATGQNYALGTGACQICLYYSSGSHTLEELTADSTVTGWIADAINAGIRLVGAQVNSESEITTLLNLGLIGAQTRLSRLISADALDITNLEMAAVSGDSATTLTLTDGKGNRKTAEIPKLTLSDDQVQSGVESWMDANAKPTTVWSKNVYNPADAVTGYIASAGQINASTSYWTTGFIPVSPGDVLTLSKSGARINAYYQAAYDSGKALVSRNSGNANTYTVPAGAAYARFSIKLSAAATSDPVMICINNTDLSYEEYGSHTEGGLGAYLILQSPSGRNFTLKVSDEGVVSAEEVE